MRKLKKIALGVAGFLLAPGTALARSVEDPEKVPFNVGDMWDSIVSDLDPTWAEPLNWLWDNLVALLAIATIFFILIAAMKHKNARRGGSVSDAVQADYEMMDHVKRYALAGGLIVLTGVIYFKFWT